MVREFNYRGYQIKAHYTNDRNVSSFLFQHDGYLVYSNSHRAVRRIIDAVTEIEPSLHDELDYRYLTTLLPPADDEQSGYFYASDAFIRKMVSAEAKISQKRRMQCFNNLIMQNNASLFFRLENGRAPKSLSELSEDRYVDTNKIICPHGGAYAIDTENDTCTCSLHNRLKYLTPNSELSVHNVSRREYEEYGRYRERYEQFWQKVFDPIAIRISVNSSVKPESCILPMANSGIYDDLRERVQKNPLPLATSRIAPSALASFLMVPGREKTAELIRMVPGVPEVVEDDPTLTDLNWIGDRVSVHVCDGDSILEIDPTRIKPLDLPMVGKASTNMQGMVAAVFMMANLPVYATVEVENREKASRLLEQLAERVFLQDGDVVGFETQLDAYQLPDYKEHDIYVLNVGVYAISLRLHVSLVGDQLVMATEPEVLHEVIDASTTPINQDAPDVHMLLRLNHRALNRLSDDVQLYWAEKSRVSCHRNVISIYNFHKLYGVPIKDIPELSEAKYGVRYYCPDHGEYTFDKELNQVVCSVHGNREHAQQRTRLKQDSSFSRFIQSLDTITASLHFHEGCIDGHRGNQEGPGPARQITQGESAPSSIPTSVAVINLVAMNRLRPHTLHGNSMTATAKPRDPAKDQDWSDLAAQFRVRPDTIYFNHGSFGLAPDVVRYARRKLINQLDENPMDFYVRQFEELLADAKAGLGQFVGTAPSNLVFVDNATYGMNVVAHSFPLKSGDEVLLNNHEYGAVARIWERKCTTVGARCSIARLPERIESHQQIVDGLLAGITSKTKLLVVSHVTSATALVMPVQQICQQFAGRGIAVCIDGPHALAQVDFKIDDLGCDFYTASCHKWLCSTLGSGFLFAAAEWHDQMQPIMKSWGRLLPAIPQTWDEEFTWMGTRDPSPFLSIPVAIDFLDNLGFDSFRQRSNWLANQAEQALTELFGTRPIAHRDRGCYGSMAHVPLPKGEWSRLQQQLWEQIGIEVPVICFEDRWFIRVSCHLYNNSTQIETLVKALERLCCHS